MICKHIQDERSCTKCKEFRRRTFWEFTMMMGVIVVINFSIAIILIYVK